MKKKAYGTYRHKYEVQKRYFFRWLTIFVCLVFLHTSQGYTQQYNASGTAIPISPAGCYQLTSTTGQAGAVWNVNQMNLTLPFDITLTLNFGNRPGEDYNNQATCGADGMSFVLQPLNTGVFGLGSGVGFHGITPSLGVIMDVYSANPTDPPGNHISISKNGDELHGTANELVPPSAAVGFPANIKDGQNHTFRFKWAPGATTGVIDVYFDGTHTLTYTGNLINNIFGGNPIAYWGMSASTGGCWNVQKVCMTTVADFITDTVCSGQAMQFYDKSISGAAISTWTWDFGDGTTGIGLNPPHVYSNPGNFTTQLTITNSAGFTSTMSHVVKVYPTPSVTVTDDTICNGDEATLSASGALNYTWYPIGVIGNPVTVTPSGTTTYTVIGKSDFGCRDTAFLTIHAFPAPNLTIINDTICENDTATLKISGANNFLWENGLTTSQITVTPIVTTNYNVSAFDNFGCKKDTFATVLVNPIPVPSFMPSIFPANGCAPFTIAFTDNTSPIMQSYLWDFGDGNTSTNQNPAHTYTTDGIFDISLSGYSSEGCFGTYKSTALVNVYPVPNASFTATPPLSTLSQLVLFNSSASSSFVTSWNWDFGDPASPQNNSTSQNPDHVFSNVGTYQIWLKVTSDKGCIDSALLSVKVVPDSLIVPNVITPNGDGINDYFDIPNLDSYAKNSLYIYNRWGKMVYERENYIPQNDKWDGKDLPDGTYFVVLRYDNLIKEVEYKGVLNILRGN